jgi:hypothetical protein
MGPRASGFLIGTAFAATGSFFLLQYDVMRRIEGQDKLISRVESVAAALRPTHHNSTSDRGIVDR